MEAIPNKNLSHFPIFRVCKFLKNTKKPIGKSKLEKSIRSISKRTGNPEKLKQRRPQLKITRANNENGCPFLNVK